VIDATLKLPAVKRVALFGATVLLPCGLLVVFGSIMIRQDRELAVRHAEDQRRTASVQLRQQRTVRLEQMKREAAEAFFGGRRPVAAFAAVVAGSTVAAPWDAAPARFPALDACEIAEFAPGRLVEGIACYERLVERPEGPRFLADARLLLARALLRAEKAQRALAVDRQLLATPLSVTDDQGVPFACYAADRLLRRPSAEPWVAARFQAAEPQPPDLSPAGAYLWKSIADRLGDAALQHRAAAAIVFGNEVEALRADLPGLLPALRRDTPEPIWIEHGPWQIGLAKSPESGKELLVGIASADLPAEDSVLPAPPVQSRTGIYVASLALVFLIAASGALLLVRDVRRDLEIAELRSQFVSSVSHELKTPLTAIRMFAETLRLRPGGVAQEEYLETIVQESERLSRLVDNVLDFSKIEQGRRVYHLRPTPVRAILDSVGRAVEYPLRQAGFRLSVTAAEALPEVHGDPDALQQALLNLVGNAMKYSGERKEIEIAASRADGAVVIEVRDYGIGIPAEYRQRIFERFFRVPSAENQRVPGAGLGLTLVAHIAKAHGGTISVESEPGAGSLFSLRLPAEPPL
jgi:signal transduction histidine kinase